MGSVEVPYTKLNRRSFLGSSLAAGLITSTAAADDPEMTTIAAVQMGCQVGDMAANLEEAEHWIRHAIRRGAQWVVLPELFVSGMSYHPAKMLDAIQPLDGEATQMLKKLAKEGRRILAVRFSRNPVQTSSTRLCLRHLTVESSRTTKTSHPVSWSIHSTSAARTVSS